MRILIAALALFGMSSGNAWAWGQEGHAIVCDIAFRLAKPNTRTAIQRLLRNDPVRQFRTNFAASCNFPDGPPRRRGGEHFVNLARDAQGIAAGTPCPTTPKCVVTAITNDAQILGSRGRPADKLLALKFLGHWVGDVHQPLHVSFKDDTGGNDISVSGECSGKFHSTWDTCLVRKAGGTNVTQAATALIAAITPQMKQQWLASSDPRDWANESYEITRAAATKYCVMQGQTCAMPSPPSVTIDSAYVATNMPIVKTRLQQAGVRLAAMLDKAFGN